MTMFESQLIRQEIKSDLQSALAGVRELEKCEDIEAPAPEFCGRLAKAIESALELL